MEAALGADTNIIGKPLELVYVVIGVMKPEFRWPRQADLLVPLGLNPAAYSEDNGFNESHATVARRPGGSVQQANPLISVLSDRARNESANEKFARDSGWGMFAVPITDFIAGASKKPLFVLLTAVGFVLLIACANFAGLMLARVSSLSQEIAVRCALGGRRWDLLRQRTRAMLVIREVAAAFVLAVGAEYE